MPDVIVDSEIIVAIVGAVGTIVAAIVGYLSQRRQRRGKQQAETEIAMQRVALDFGLFLSEWREITEEVEKLFEETDLQRFLILRAFNGVYEPKWATAVLQVRAEGQTPHSYVHYELDRDYKERLSRIQTDGYSRIIVRELERCGIKDIYDAESVTDSLWAFIDKQAIMSGTHRASVITYCSFATLNPNGLSDDTITRCKVLVGRLKGAAQIFHSNSDTEL